LTLTPDTLVVIKAQGRSTVTGLQPGQQVYVRYDTATMTIEKIRVNDHQISWENRGTKQGVYAENNGHKNDFRNNGSEHGNKDEK
jgi:hypothetical protein